MCYAVLGIGMSRPVPHPRPWGDADVDTLTSTVTRVLRMGWCWQGARGTQRTYLEAYRVEHQSCHPAPCCLMCQPGFLLCNKDLLEF